jgi:uncharacterized protein (TIGR00369 family)
MNMIEQLQFWLNRLHEVAPDSAGDILGLEVLYYNEQTEEFLMRGRTQAWMRNAHGTLHGGICATMADQAMGSVACCYKRGEGILPAIELGVNYHRPLIPWENVLLRVRKMSATRTLIHVTAELYRQSQPEKLCSTAHATYFYKED